jgi:hypothetical protein
MHAEHGGANDMVLLGYILVADGQPCLVHDHRIAPGYCDFRTIDRADRKSILAAWQRGARSPRASAGRCLLEIGKGKAFAGLNRQALKRVARRKLFRG